MAYVVGDACVKCKFTDCVDVCPVDCFYEGENALVIHPEDCIDCGACEPECPTTAIFEEDDLPDNWKPYIEINAVFSGDRPPDEADTQGWPQHLIDAIKSPGFEVWPVITEKIDAPAGADDEKEREDKIADLSPAPGPGS